MWFVMVGCDGAPRPALHTYSAPRALANDASLITSTITTTHDRNPADCDDRYSRRAVRHLAAGPHRLLRAAGGGANPHRHRARPGHLGRGVPGAVPTGIQIGRASCRARVCQYVEISVVAVSLKKK